MCVFLSVGLCVLVCVNVCIFFMAEAPSLNMCVCFRLKCVCMNNVICHSQTEKLALFQASPALYHFLIDLTLKHEKS